MSPLDQQCRALVGRYLAGEVPFGKLNDWVWQQVAATGTDAQADERLMGDNPLFGDVLLRVAEYTSADLNGGLPTTAEFRAELAELSRRLP